MFNQATTKQWQECMYEQEFIQKRKNEIDDPEAVRNIYRQQQY